jgi:AraC-like DNA-binding protein
MSVALRWQSVCPNGEIVHVKDTHLPGSYRTFIHTHDFYEFFITRTGVVRHFVNGRQFDMPRHWLCLVAPADEHCFQAHPRSGRAVFTNVAFPARIYEQAAGYLPSAPRRARASTPLMLCPVGGSTLACLLESLPVLGREGAGEAQQRLLLSRVLVMVLSDLVLLSHEAARDRGSDLPPWLGAAMRAMEEPQNFSAGLPRFVALAGKSQEHLTRTVRACCATTPTAFVNALRLREAARLLRDTDQKVQAVALRAGFGNMAYFLTRFRQRYGCTPREYRVRHGMVTDPVGLAG